MDIKIFSMFFSKVSAKKNYFCIARTFSSWSSTIYTQFNKLEKRKKT